MSPDPLRTTPLIERHRRAGARLVPFAGWQMPVQYAGVVEEHHAVRQRAGLFDVSHMGEIEVLGSGAEDFLQWLTPNDVGRLAPGRAHYSALLTDRGTMIDDLLIYRMAPDHFFLVVNAGPLRRDLDWILDHQPSSGVEIRDRSDETALLALQGPRACTILQPLTDLDLSAMRYYSFADGRVGGSEAMISRTGYTGEDGFELYLSSEDGVAVWDRLLEVGGEHGLQPVGLGARDTLRLEAGMLLSGQDFDDRTTPLEAGVGWFVKLGKGDFLGREPLLRQKEDGTGRRLIAFEILGRGIARHGHSIRTAGGSGGEVTSGSWSPTLEKAIGLAMVEPSPADEDSELVVEVRGRSLEARRADLPFYRRPK